MSLDFDWIATALAARFAPAVVTPPAGYASLVRSMVPAGYWRLGEKSGTAADSSGNGVTGTYVGSPTLNVAGAITGDPDTAITLDGSTQYADLPVAVGTTGSIAVWFKRTRTNVTEAVIGSATNGPILLFTAGSDTLSFSKQDVATLVIGLSITNTNWHFAVATFDGVIGNARLYVDGVLYGPGGAATPSAVTALRLGTYDVTHVLKFAGSVDEVATFPRALTAAEVAALYTMGTAAAYDNVRVSTADLPNQMTPLPTVLVFLDSGDFSAFPGKRDGRSEWSVRFYYNQAGDLARDMKALRLWLAVLVDQLKAATQLGGIVTSARVMSWRIGVLNYAGLDYTGIELGVHVVTNEGWQAVA